MEHRSRARTGHLAPVYEWMRTVGVENVQIEILDEDPAQEVAWIVRLLEEGHPLQNEQSSDGIEFSNSDSTRQRMSASKAGRPTWSKGKTGEAAGWTEERRRAESERRRTARVSSHGSQRERQKYGCDCTECLAWEEQYYADIEAKKLINQHGTMQSYKRGKCRCDECRAAAREYHQALRERKKDGSGDPALGLG